MTWQMPAETDPHERIWMAFPRAGASLGAGDVQAGYEAWAAVAHAVAEFEPVTMVADPSEVGRAKGMLGEAIDVIEAPLDDFWMRDIGPTFVFDERGTLGAVDWTFNAWGVNHPEATWHRDDRIASFVANESGAEIVSSLLVNEGGAMHVDGEGTVLITETVQLDPRRNPHTDKRRVEAELERTVGATHVIWLPRGLTRDYEQLGTRGHVDMVAAIPSPGTLLLHEQQNPGHPDFAVSRELRSFLETTRDAAGREWRIISLPAPETLEDDEGFVDWNYVNHLVVNGGVIACGYGDERADARARELLAEVYPGRRVVTVDAREILARGGGIHCITQQQPARRAR
ncbi:agmatine deiminase family protein [Subtercola endophyticus]|uniref:agmatine deiminase family protein n=1 Tax=Subtercola endophyticus TaxID=2895559 RepID=UPI001E631F84|nr:agmatine deiminase family protein [Subtercola endophyticus]UFS57556.1 agmatine deiminase family protein [Subtercola endophyticus]